MKPETFDCPKCGSATKCRSGWRPWAGRPNWKRRTRTCSGCGYAAAYADIPMKELSPYLSSAKARTEARGLISKVNRSLAAAEKLSRGLS